jgi:hypothetical protein
MSTRDCRPADHGAAEEKTPAKALSNAIVGESAGIGADSANCPLCVIAAQRRRQPQLPSLCGRCGGPSSPGGGWCEGCIRECREYTQWLDSQAGGAP